MAVEPVKEILSIPGWAVSQGPRLSSPDRALHDAGWEEPLGQLGELEAAVWREGRGLDYDAVFLLRGPGRSFHRLKVAMLALGLWSENRTGKGVGRGKGMYRVGLGSSRGTMAATTPKGV